MTQESSLYIIAAEEIVNLTGMEQDLWVSWEKKPTYLSWLIYTYYNLTFKLKQYVTVTVLLHFVYLKH